LIRICLNKKKISNNQSELALFSGWGYADVDATKETFDLKKAIYNISSTKQCSDKKLCGFERKNMICFVRKSLST